MHLARPRHAPRKCHASSPLPSRCPPFFVPLQDELTLDNMSRPQLASMCVYMGLRPYGSDNFLRFQLRAKLRGLKEDDQRIVWEGIDNMTKEELREACRVRQRVGDTFHASSMGLLTCLAWHVCGCAGEGHAGVRVDTARVPAADATGAPPSFTPLPHSRDSALLSRRQTHFASQS